MINSVNYQGRLVRDIELKYTDSQVAYTEFTIAWSEKYKEVETKCFLRCKAWRQSAEFISKYFAKGQEIAINGHLVTEEWEKEGEKQSRTICMVDKVHFCGNKANNSDSNSQNSNTNFVNVPEGMEEELPFN